MHLGTAVALALAAGIQPADAQYYDGDLFHIELEQIRDGIYVAFRPDPLRLVEGNATIIVNDRDVVVVDGSGAPVAAERVIREIEKITDKPVRYLINTHGHGDHTLGNQVYARTWPGVEIVAHPGTRGYMVGSGLDYVGNLVENLAARQAQARSDIDTLAARLEREGNPGRRELIAYLNQYWGPDMAERARQFSMVEITPPTLSVPDSLILHRGAREIHVLHLGWGDTASDLVVYLPQDRVVITGDMLVHPIPYGFSDRPREWVATLGRLMELDFDTLVPGHGEVQHGKGWVRKVRRLVQSIGDRVAAAVEDGATRDDLLDVVDVSDLEEEFAGDDPVARFRFMSWFSNPAILDAYNDMYGSEEG